MYEISISSLALGFLLISVPSAFAGLLRIGVTRELLYAALRAAFQLMLVGFVLRWTLSQRDPFAAVILLIAMILIAGVNAQRRQKFPYPSLWLKASLVIVFATMGPLSFALCVVVRADPWYDPHLLVPLAGMILGNAMTSLVLGLDRFYAGLKDQWRIVEARLSLGATRYQACLPVTRGAARAALLPLINTMMIIGVVHLPGMIVGQITAGSDPAQASRYQLMIMYVIGATNSLSTLGVIYLGIRRFTTTNHQLCYHLLEDGAELTRLGS